MQATSRVERAAIRPPTAWILAVLFLLAPVGVRAQGADVSACTGCHGEKGVSETPKMPNIAGLTPGYLLSVFSAYLDSSRPSAVQEHLEKITQETAMPLSEFYGGQPWENAKANGGQVDAAKAAAGEKLATKCLVCHEEKGKSQVDDMPRLAGQKLDYLQERLHSFRTDTALPMPKKMAVAFNELPEADLDAIAHFFASQN